MTREAIDVILNLSGAGVIAGQILLILLILLFALFQTNRKIKRLKPFFNFISYNSITFAFLVSVIATIGSLFLSEIAQIPPCRLCWYQRIFMFPLPIILGIALIKEDAGVKKYVIPLAAIGSIIAIYNYILQTAPALALPCVNDAVSCTTKQIELFGYITIPLMSLTAFLLILIFLFLAERKTKTN